MNIEELRQCLAIPGDRVVQAKRAVKLIRRSRNYRWAGLYDVGGSEISVIAWDGPGAPTHPRFPITSGLNGAAVASGAAVIVQDVSKTRVISPRLELQKPRWSCLSGARLVKLWARLTWRAIASERSRTRTASSWKRARRSCCRCGLPSIPLRQCFRKVFLRLFF
jgi:hypothetical protein